MSLIVRCEVTSYISNGFPYSSQSLSDIISGDRVSVGLSDNIDVSGCSGLSVSSLARALEFTLRSSCSNTITQSYTIGIL